MQKERRRNTRVTAGFSVRVATGRKTVPLTTWNVSLRGLECPTDPSFKQGRTCQVKFTLSPAVSFTVKGTFVRVEEHESGIFFTSMDAEGFYHLKRLVQYNAVDPDRIDAELARHFRETTR